MSKSRDIAGGSGQPESLVDPDEANNHSGKDLATPVSGDDPKRITRIVNPEHDRKVDRQKGQQTT